MVLVPVVVRVPEGVSVAVKVDGFVGMPVIDCVSVPVPVRV